MSASQGCIDNKVVVESFKEALIGRVGADRYRMWFTHGVEFAIHGDPSDSSSPADQSTSATGGTSLAQRAGWTLIVKVRGQFALDRLRKNFLRELRGAAMQACGSLADVHLCLDEPPAQQTALPLKNTDGASNADDANDADGKQGRTCTEGGGASSNLSTHSNTADAARPNRPRRAARRPKRSQSSSAPAVSPLSRLVASSAERLSDRPNRDKQLADAAMQLQLPDLAAAESDVQTTGEAAGNVTGSRVDPAQSSPQPAAGKPSASGRAAMSASTFVLGSSNQLAHTAMTMVCQNPATATPLFLCGPTGTGKTHMMSAIADQLRRRHRMRRVMHLSAEQFTNDFISSVGNSGITAFRRRYREVDALLIDDVQFLGSKKATLREMLYTVETLASAGRPLIFSGLQSPTEIQGLSRELAGRMAAGLVCSVQPLDQTVRLTLLRRWLDQRCPLEVPESMMVQISDTLRGDGRVISGVVNVMNTLQRMYGRVPTMDELRRFAGDLLRSATPVATLGVIEQAVCDAFGLPADTLRGRSQTRAVTEPRMLAMYLSRQLTSSAYAEIARHFGGKSHSTAISAENNVKAWLQNGKSIGRGQAAMPAQAALDRIEGLLRSG